MVAVAIGGAAILGTAATVSAGSKAANAQKDASNQTVAEQRRQYDITRNDLAPYRDTGYAALGKLSSLYGVNPNSGKTDWGAYVNGNPDALANWNAIKNTSAGAQFNGDINAFGQYHYGQDGSRRDLAAYTPTDKGTGADYGGFQASPGYQFRRDEGLKAIQRSASARGLLASGGAIKAQERFADNTASSEFENYANHLSALAGVGQNATNATSAAGQSSANNISEAYTNAGNARASSYINTGNAINSGLNNLVSVYAYGQGGGFGKGSGSYSLPQGTWI